MQTLVRRVNEHFEVTPADRCTSHQAAKVDQLWHRRNAAHVLASGYVERAAEAGARGALAWTLRGLFAAQ